MNKIPLIIAREFTQRVFKRSFIITTILVPVLMVALMVMPAMFMATSKDTTKREIVVIDKSGEITPKLESSETLIFIPTDLQYEEAVKSFNNVYGFLVLGHDIITSPNSISLYTREAVTMGITGDIKSQLTKIIEEQRVINANIPQLDSLIASIKVNSNISTFQIDETSSSEIVNQQSSIAASSIFSYIGGFMIYMFVLMYGSMVMQGVIEEKSNRILEVIVSSVKPFELMIGKIVGIGCVALTQFIVWIVITAVGFTIIETTLLADTMQTTNMSAMGGGGVMASGITSDMGGFLSTITNPMFLFKMLGGFFIFFIGGYLLYASMFAAIGSAVDDIQDVGQLQMPVTMPLIVSIVVLMGIIQNPHSPMAVLFSMIPLTSPIIMIARIPFGVPLWQFALSAVILFGSFILTTWLAAKIYRTGIFMYGKKPTLKEMMKWIKY